MSRPNEDRAEDDLLGALRRLPGPAMEPDAESRLRGQVQAAYRAEFGGEGARSPWSARLGRAAVPVLLAGIVGLYLTWAIGAASALMQ